jgi:hypothetical protein
MLKPIRLPSFVSAVTLAVWLAAPAIIGSNQADAQGIHIQFGSHSSGYYNGYGSGYGGGYYGHGSGYGTGYASPYTRYGYSPGYTGYGYGQYAHYGHYGYRSPGLYTYPTTNIYNSGYGRSPYSASIQFQGRGFGHNYNRVGGYHSYSPYGF